MQIGNLPWHSTAWGEACRIDGPVHNFNIERRRNIRVNTCILYWPTLPGSVNSSSTWESILFVTSNFRWDWYRWEYPESPYVLLQANTSLQTHRHPALVTWISTIEASDGTTRILLFPNRSSSNRKIPDTGYRCIIITNGSNRTFFDLPKLVSGRVLFIDWPNESTSAG